MSGIRKEFPNNWSAIEEAPSEYFDSCTWEEFVLFKLNGWELPSSVQCIIRAENNVTGVVTEHCYQRPHAAQDRLIKYLRAGQHTLTICNSDAIHLLKTNDPRTD